MSKDTKSDNTCLTSDTENFSSSLFNLSAVCKKPIELGFTAAQVSSDGGLLLLREVESQSGILNAITNCIEEDPHPGYIKHSLSSMLTQRVFQIAAGYEDANDCNDTNSNTYGAQQLSLFNDYYGEYCFMPLHIYEGLSGKLITTILKPGRRSKTADVFSILQRIIFHLRKVWENTMIIVRGDGHFCGKELMAWAKEQDKVHFLTGLTGNKPLNDLARITIDSAEKQYKSTGKLVKRYHSFDYAAGSWSGPQRVIVKVEVSEKGTNIRYVVTDIRFIRTKALYEQGYYGRGKMELYIKESKTYLESDRMSFSRFEANQFRLFMHSAAYVFLHTLRSETLRATKYATATMKTIRLRLIKVAAYVKEMKTRIKIEFPKQFPDMELIANCLGIFNVLQC